MLSAITAGKGKSHKRSKSRSRSRKHKKYHRRAGAAPAPLPAYGDYFQDYAQVGGGYAPSFYDNYAAYADPRVAGAYDTYYDAVDPRYAGAVAPLAPVDPYADWTQARYAGAADGFVDYGMQAPLIAGDSDSFVGGKMGRAAHSRRKPGSRSKTVHVKASKRVKGQHKGRAMSSKRGGVSKTASNAAMYQPALIGGYDAYTQPMVGGYAPADAYGYDAYAQPMVGGYAPADAYGYAPMVGGYGYEPAPLTAGFEVDPLAGGSKHKSYNRRKPGASKKAKKTVHVKASKRAGGSRVGGKKSRSRSRSRRHHRKH